MPRHRAQHEWEGGTLGQRADGERLWHAQSRMRGTPRLPDSRAGASRHLRILGSLLQPAASALVVGLALAAGLRAPAGRSLTLSPLHEIGATPIVRLGTSQARRCLAWLRLS